MKKYISLCFLLFFAGCGSSGDAQQKLVMVPESTIIINVLDKKYFDDCHIAGSIHVSFDAIEEFAAKTNRTKKIIVYCSNYQCTASHYIAEKLASLGFTDVVVYSGGTAEWYQKGLPVVGACTSSYLQQTSLPEKPSGDVAVISYQDLAQHIGISLP